MIKEPVATNALSPLLLSSYAEKPKLCRNFVENGKILSSAPMSSTASTASTAAAA